MVLGSSTAFFRGVFAGVGSIPAVLVIVVEREDGLCEEFCEVSERLDICRAGLSFTASVGSGPLPWPEDFFRGELVGDPGGDSVPVSLRLCFRVLVRPDRACFGELGGGVVCESRAAL